MEQELKYLTHALQSPERPFVAILGGAKVSDKLEVIENLLGKVNRLIIGGAMAYTFLKSRGVPTGKSLVEDDKLEAARSITADAAAKGVELALPVDHVVTERLAPDAANEVLAIDDPAIGDRMGVDIGPKTIAAYRDMLRDAHTVVWNGPMGVFEIAAFAAAPMPWRALSPTSAARPSSVAATPYRPSASRAGRSHYAYLHGRRRVTRISRRTHAPRRRGARGQESEAGRGRRSSMRTPVIAGNWKMFKTVHEAVAFAKEFKSLVKDVSGVDIVLAPPFTAVHAVADAVRASNIAVAAQDVFWEREGAYTGEVSAAMVQEAGAEYVIIGHSERRRLFGDTDVAVNRKLMAAIGAGSDADCVHWRNARGAGDPSRRSRARPAVEGRARRNQCRAGRRTRHRVRAGVGDRDRPECNRRAGAGRPCAHSRPSAPVVRCGRRRSGAAFCTAEA